MTVAAALAHGKDVDLQGAAMRFGGFQAVAPTDLLIHAGEFFSILGPSGCGKTTILRMISGFLQPTDGRVLIGGQDMKGVGPNKRPTALIFQNLALFPLMSVWENVAFGLEARGVARGERKRRAQALLELVALGDQGDKRPSELSGGQRQRVAIARALAVEPAVLLLDEPLSALDLKLRQHMRAELRAIQRKIGITFVYITHDQGEALTMSDRIAVMNQGVIEQVDAADVLYNQPRTAFVATFVGEHNTVPGTLGATHDGVCRIDTPLGPLHALNPHALTPGSPALLFVRPERMRLLNGATKPPANAFEATLHRRDLEGAFLHLHLEAAGQSLVVHQTNTGTVPAPGTHRLGFEPDEARVLPPGALAHE
ncbi:ABC transporter ATP-binding protein [Pararhodospirillum oryzae]|uniref:Polyamine-transporting ATPase n=1 Tax=Pararhodospirillum oryzae TaxID=478448 RepID=A0A512H5A3_9PROT|nr:ABC transporter ATP-binding protein [Pararhodospirillum oryzae]GEO80611.1 polyamine-transporting ATPase [Pararhodospirillum oryzae]